MTEFTKENLLKYIELRTKILEKRIQTGIIPGLIDSIDIYKIKGRLYELAHLKEWLDE